MDKIRRHCKRAETVLFIRHFGGRNKTNYGRTQRGREWGALEPDHASV
jgi:protein gp37